MRIWDVPVRELCREHLLGEHRELHAIWSVITNDKKGYRNHPETIRWIDNLAALYIRHEQEVSEMRHRGYNHDSDLNIDLVTGSTHRPKSLISLTEQRDLLRTKHKEKEWLDF